MKVKAAVFLLAVAANAAPATHRDDATASVLIAHHSKTASSVAHAAATASPIEASGHGRNTTALHRGTGINSTVGPVGGTAVHGALNSTVPFNSTVALNSTVVANATSSLPEGCSICSYRDNSQYVWHDPVYRYTNGTVVPITSASQMAAIAGRTWDGHHLCCGDAETHHDGPVVKQLHTWHSPTQNVTVHLKPVVTKQGQRVPPSKFASADPDQAKKKAVGNPAAIQAKTAAALKAVRRLNARQSSSSHVGTVQINPFDLAFFSQAPACLPLVSSDPIANVYHPSLVGGLHNVNQRRGLGLPVAMGAGLMCPASSPGCSKTLTQTTTVSTQLSYSVTSGNTYSVANALGHVVSTSESQDESQSISKTIEQSWSHTSTATQGGSVSDMVSDMLTKTSELSIGHSKSHTDDESTTNTATDEVSTTASQGGSVGIGTEWSKSNAVTDGITDGRSTSDIYGNTQSNGGDSSDTDGNEGSHTGTTEQGQETGTTWNNGGSNDHETGENSALTNSMNGSSGGSSSDSSGLTAGGSRSSGSSSGSSSSTTDSTGENSSNAQESSQQDCTDEHGTVSAGFNIGIAHGDASFTAGGQQCGTKGSTSTSGTDSSHASQSGTETSSNQGSESNFGASFGHETGTNFNQGWGNDATHGTSASNSVGSNWSNGGSSSHSGSQSDANTNGWTKAHTQGTNWGNTITSSHENGSTQSRDHSNTDTSTVGGSINRSNNWDNSKTNAHTDSTALTRGHSDTSTDDVTKSDSISDAITHASTHEKNWSSSASDENGNSVSRTAGSTNSYGKTNTLEANMEKTVSNAQNIDKQTSTSTTQEYTISYSYTVNQPPNTCWQSVWMVEVDSVAIPWACKDRNNATYITETEIMAPVNPNDIISAGGVFGTLDCFSNKYVFQIAPEQTTPGEVVPAASAYILQQDEILLANTAKTRGPWTLFMNPSGSLEFSHNTQVVWTTNTPYLANNSPRARINSIGQLVVEAQNVWSQANNTYRANEWITMWSTAAVGLNLTTGVPGRNGYSLVIESNTAGISTAERDGPPDIVLYDHNSAPLWMALNTRYRNHNGYKHPLNYEMPTDFVTGPNDADQVDAHNAIDPSIVIHSQQNNLYSRTNMTADWSKGCYDTAGYTLQGGQALRSPNGRFTLILTADGNLLVKDGPRTMWESYTKNFWYAQAPYKLRLSEFGEIFIEDVNGYHIWQSMNLLWNRVNSKTQESLNSPVHGPYTLVMQDNGQLAIWDGNQVPFLIWNQWASTDTAVRSSITYTAPHRFCSILCGDVCRPAVIYSLWSNSTSINQLWDEETLRVPITFRALNKPGANLGSINGTLVLTDPTGVATEMFHAPTVSTTGRLYLEQNGLLNMKDKANNILWSSGVSADPVTGPFHAFVNATTGELVVKDINDKKIWTFPSEDVSWLASGSKQDRLTTGESLLSPDKSWALTLDAASVKLTNTVLKSSVNLWTGSGAASFVVQGDENIVIYNNQHNALWASQSNHGGPGPFNLTLSNLGELCMTDNTGAKAWCYFDAPSNANWQPLTNVGTGRCLDFHVAAAGSPGQLWDCNGSAAQQFWLDSATGFLRMKADTQLCVAIQTHTNSERVVLERCGATIFGLNVQARWTVNGQNLMSSAPGLQLLLQYAGSGSDSSPVQIGTANGGATQAWVFGTYDPGAGLKFQPIIGKSTGKCLTLGSGAAAVGTGLVLSDCNGQDNQQFGYDATNFLLVSKVNHFLCVGQNANSNGSPIALRTCQKSDPFARIVVNNNGLISVGPGNLCIDVTNNLPDNNTPIQSWQCSQPDMAQQFALGSYSPPQPSYSSITTHQNGKCVDVGTVALGFHARLWTCVHGNNQQFGLLNGLIVIKANPYLCLGANNQADGAPVLVQYCYAGAGNKQWSQTATRGLANGNFLLDDANYGIADGNIVQLAVNRGPLDLAQMWEFGDVQTPPQTLHSDSNTFTPAAVGMISPDGTVRAWMSPTDGSLLYQRNGGTIQTIPGTSTTGYKGNGGISMGTNGWIGLYDHNSFYHTIAAPPACKGPYRMDLNNDGKFRAWGENNQNYYTSPN
ncbi:hypothetical protein HKX48_004307 [Thoreauomyces humboldtii]|nr:hypothetical protein HKX48_004307 [Thoreauomyces humboldtii]